ncbi:hypothetical protein EDB84DRAFT_424357 [Lactarius hengduanensis]|nr:hypothetical protein EDB84DRAFT_424357 [Lactarius hengduanensis]
MNPHAAQLSQQLRSVQEIRQSTGSAHDTICSDVMCIEFSVDGGTARLHYGQPDARLDGHVRLHPTSLRRADVQPTHVSDFGRNMGDSPMVVVWPSRGAEGEYHSVALLQRKALYEVMPTPDPHPPFAAKLSLTDTYVTVQNPQIAFTRKRDVEHHLGIQAPGSADSDGPISPHITKLAMACST